MSNMDQVMKEIEGGSDKPAETTPAPQPESTPAENTATEQPAESTPAAETKPKKKKDLSNVSAEEKAAYSFKKQLERQRKRDTQDFNSLLETKLADFKKELAKDAPKPSEEPVKSRKDFESDTDYVNYMIQVGIKKALAERDANHAKAAEEQKAKEEEKQRLDAIAQRDAQTMRSNIEALYEGEELAAWKGRVAKAAAKGLGEVLAASPVLKGFIMTSKWGPLVLDKMVSDNGVTLKRLMGPFSSPIEMQMELAQIAAEARAERASGASEETNSKPKGLPHIGKPGASSNAGGGNKGIFSSDEALIQFMRKRGRR